MYDLIKTTYERSFDKQIISNYLNSGQDYKIRSAILSIAQSEDTSFIPNLLKLDLNKFGIEVCFSLAQIGRCNQSINFLWNYLYSSPPPTQFPKIFFAIGKIGSENDLNRLIEFYNSFDGPIFPYEGISEAILQFQIRGIKSNDAKAILENEASHKLSSEIRIEKALFTLIRYGGASENIENVIRYYALEKDSSISQNIKHFALLNISRNKDFVFSYNELIYSLLTIKELPEAFEIPKIFIRSIKNKNELTILNNIVSRLSDINVNLAIQYARAFREIKNNLFDSLDINFKFELNSAIKKSYPLSPLKSKKPTLFAELVLDYFYFFNDGSASETITKKYVPKLVALIYDKKSAQDKLLNIFRNEDLNIKIESLNQLIELFKDDPLDSKYNQLLYECLKLDNAALVSIAADGIDSISIAENSKELKEIIFNQINKYKDNPDFLEATMSLTNLSERIDKDFYESIIEKVKTSKLYSIRKFVSSKTCNTQIGFKELDKFEDIWSNVFTYKQATIRTSKGEIVIKFDSDIAPISVANFCMLAKQNFYNGIIFHRVVPGFVIQAGDPTATGWGGPGYDIVSEYSDTDFGIGYVGMASSGKDTEGSQFFIMQGSYPHLDSRYTLFAKVIEGMDVVYNITEEDKITSVELD